MDVKKTLAAAPVAQLMAHGEAHIDKDHARLVAHEIVKDMAVRGMSIGDSYDEMEALKYYLEKRAEIMCIAISLIKDQSMHMVKEQTIDPNRLHVE